LGAEGESSQPIQANNEEDNSVQRELIFWKNGFSLGDGPLLRYDDPENQKMLEAIKSGYYYN
jgi:UBX domain-containing protein 1